MYVVYIVIYVVGFSVVVVLLVGGLWLYAYIVDIGAESDRVYVCWILMGFELLTVLMVFHS